MKIFRMIPALTVVAALGAGHAAMAQDSLPSFADLGQDKTLTAAFDKLAEGQTLPEWLRDGAVTMPGQKVGFGGKEYVAVTACKQHDCAANQFAMIYAPEGGDAFGLLSTHESDAVENLLWLGIGGNAESIDGRTILYAALTGSLANHPDAFNYPE